MAKLEIFILKYILNISFIYILIILISNIINFSNIKGIYSIFLEKNKDRLIEKELEINSLYERIKILNENDFLIGEKIQNSELFVSNNNETKLIAILRYLDSVEMFTIKLDKLFFEISYG